MALFYTGKGDRGTSHIGKKKVPKDSPILEALGDLDELNSLIGLIRSQSKKKDLVQKLRRVQENLFIIQAAIAWFLYPKFQAPRPGGEKVRAMEKEIQAIESHIRPSRGFVIPGTSTLASWLDVARAVSRRAERRVYSFSRKHRVPQEILAYLNRLSSYLYALARLEISEQKMKEPHPSYR